MLKYLLVKVKFSGNIGGPGGSVVEHWVGIQKAADSNPTPTCVAPPSHQVQVPPWCQSRARIKW
ncbi:hypothetical protein EXN66_Car008517 [Channa argus]|uniref:Uncharacterized protein n=1 Tax=Channa argus TaxID=215402 RepID=A0A6G1PR65_CHAAH|nr:hypothetical protein EXN66_Car008517 [Channa argus]